jgi:hypothetical protein
VEPLDISVRPAIATDDAARSPQGIAAAVGRIFECSPAPAQARLLHTLLQPLGALSLLGVANGVFGRIWLRQGFGPLRIGPGELPDVDVIHVVMLVEHVLQASPATVHTLLAFGPGAGTAPVPRGPTAGGRKRPLRPAGFTLRNPSESCKH